MLNVTDTSISIANRFFLAIDTLKDMKKIRGLKTFAKIYGLNQGNLANARNNVSCRQVKAEYLAFLCKDFDISAEWLLLGSGPMFKQTSSKI